MSIKLISECCYTCDSCLIVKKICQLKLIPIVDIYKDNCDKYSPRKMENCLVCGQYVVSLPQHVSQEHGLTMSEYKIISKDKEQQNTRLRRKAVWES